MKKIFGLIFLLAFCFELNANNLQVSNLSLSGQNESIDYVMVQFDISWDNSWRTDDLNGDGVTNWDAVWLFVKYKKSSDGNWYHATLNSTSGNHNTGSKSTDATIVSRSDGKGAFFYRSGNGSGTFSTTGLQLRWEYGTDGLSDDLNSDVSEIKVFGIEMVYVPQGSFYVGSGGTEPRRFYTFGGTSAYQITFEDAINVGQTNGYLWASGSIETSTIPASFPKGYSAFYCMKYEITQEQYVDFLNTLTRSQQHTRTETILASGVTSVTNRYVMSSSSTMQGRNGIRCDETIHATDPITFYCDFNGNGTGNESDDGQNIACNWLSWADGAAYSDWSGLRPMTELEFEKACRGTLDPVANEYAWGNTTISQANAVSNSGSASEIVTSGNCNYRTTSNPNNGPIRVGIFATSDSDRASSGASYYGIMEMSGNLWERPVTIGNSSGRSFTGVNGDGSLDVNGNANVSNWPGTIPTGSGFRGGQRNSNNSQCQVSDRSSSTYNASSRDDGYGFRCCVGSELP